MASIECQQLILNAYRSNLEVVDFDIKGVKPRGFPERSILLFGRNNSLSYYDGKYNQITAFTTLYWQATLYLMETLIELVDKQLVFSLTLEK